ncbi:unnamed protein product [Oreochromis niloticus]|nr:unnamed protein product [Mustela putorius furo]
MILTPSELPKVNSPDFQALKHWPCNIPSARDCRWNKYLQPSDVCGELQISRRKLHFSSLTVVDYRTDMRTQQRNFFYLAIVFYLSTSAPAEDAQIRLMDPDKSGSTQCYGRVEIYHNNSSGTVCDDDWNLNDAEVVCRQLDCGPALEATRSAQFGEGSGEIWLDNVACSGWESSLIMCNHRGFGTHNCGHDEDAGVICSGIRLAGSQSVLCSGRVEIYHKNSWGTVCDHSWDLNDAEVVCRQLDCGPALEATQSSHFGKGTGQIWLDDVSCSGRESSLTECQHGGFGTHNCTHSRDAGVICSGAPIRLAGSGSTQCSGRVEMYYQKRWGTVCDDGWDLNDAEVVCRQLDCGMALSALQSAHFGEGKGDILLDNVACSGNESSLTECQHRGFRMRDCKHHEDAGVICSDSTDSIIPVLRCVFLPLILLLENIALHFYYKVIKKQKSDKKENDETDVSRAEEVEAEEEAVQEIE